MIQNRGECLREKDGEESMFIDVSTSKKVPRILMPAISTSSDVDRPLRGLSWMWPDRSRSEVFDLSLAGIIVGAQGHLEKVKMGQHLESRLDLDDKGNSILLKVKVSLVSRDFIGLSFEALSSDRRLVVEQHVKDRILIQNIKEHRIDPNMIYFKGAQWFHAPFDTNIFLWQDRSGFSLEKAIIEYDNCLWIFDQHQGVQVHKSGAATDPAKGYLHIPGLIEKSRVKISVGASWLDRLNKCLEVIIQGAYLPGQDESLRLLQHILKSN